GQAPVAGDALRQPLGVDVREPEDDSRGHDERRDVAGLLRVSAGARDENGERDDRPVDESREPLPERCATHSGISVGVYQRCTLCDGSSVISSFDRVSVTTSDFTDATAPIGTVTSRRPHKWPRSRTKSVMWSVSSTRKPSTSPM